MDYTIYIILAFLVIWIIFSKKIDAYLGKKLKSILNVDEELLKNKQTENTLFLRDKLITSSQTETSINPTIFKPKISRSLISIWFLFIVIGIVFTFIVTKDYKSIMQFFPLIWTIYGVIPPKRAASKSRINTSPAFSAGRVSLLKPSYAFALE